MEEEINKPTNLSECFKCLDDIFKDSPDSDWFETSGESEVIAQSHHGLGQWIRNNWNLLSEESTLYQYFKKLGLKHADDMSGVILTSYHRHINKKELGLDEQIRQCIEFWKNNSNDR